jgi:hypothetical protein
VEHQAGSGRQWEAATVQNVLAGQKSLEVFGCTSPMPQLNLLITKY